MYNEIGYDDLEGVTVEASGTCLTLVMETDGSGLYDGFAAEISCGMPCQDFTIDIVSSTPQPTDTNENIILACQNTPFEITAQGNYPNSGIPGGYLQSDDDTDWYWSILTAQGTEEIVTTNVLDSYEFSDAGIYYINLIAEDQNGCEAYLSDPMQILVLVLPKFSGKMSDGYQVGPGEEINLSGFVQVEEFVVVIPEIVYDTVCFSDDFLDVPQGGSFVYNVFQPGQTITSIDDIESICMELEHSYVGDLDLWVECPNGSTVQLVSYPNGCSTAEFGDAFDEYDDNAPDIDCDDPSTIGTMYQYCWSPTATDVIADVCTYGTSIPSDTYAAEANSFQNLIGCPLNGEWMIWAQDNIGSDDGAAAMFELHFADYIIPSDDDLISFQNTYDISATSTDVFWSGENVQTTNGPETSANPSTPGDQPYVFTVIDNFGCSYDTTLIINVLPFDDASCCQFPTANAGPDDHVCTNTYTFGASLATGNTGTWTVVSGPGNVNWTNPNSPNAIATVDTWGVYEFEWTEQNLTPTCTDSDQVIVEFYPVPTTTFTFDQIMCNGDHTIITYIGNVDATATYTWNFDGATIHSGSGQGPYEISWNTAGLHSIELQVTANGCDSPDTLVNINNPAVLTHTLQVDDDPCFQSCRGRAELTVSGGTLPYSYSWGSPTNILPNLCVGNYNVTVTDANGCTTSDSFVVSEPPELVINSTSTTNLTCFESNDGEIVINASGGTGNLNYIWSDIGVSNSSRQNLPAGVYVTTVVDENGCEVIEQF